MTEKQDKKATKTTKNSIRWACYSGHRNVGVPNKVMNKDDF